MAIPNQKSDFDAEDIETLRVEAYLGNADARAALGKSRPTRFDALVSFVENWFDSGLRETMLSRLEMDRQVAQLPFAIPAALREWCRLVGIRPDQQEAQNAFCTGSMLKVLRRDYGLAVYCENQGNWEYFVRTEDLGLDDPVVWTEGTWGEPATSTGCTLSECLFAGALDETRILSQFFDFGPFGIFRNGTTQLARKEVTGETVKQLLKLIPPLVGPLSPWMSDVAGLYQNTPWEVLYHGNADVLVSVMGPVGALESAEVISLTDSAINALGI